MFSLVFLYWLSTTHATLESVVGAFKNANEVCTNTSTVSECNASHGGPPRKSTFTMSSVSWSTDSNPSFSNMVNSVFPIDSVISYNASGRSAPTEIIARYASFSAVLSDQITGHYVFVAGSACSEIDAHTHPEYVGKILIVPRGKCTFVKKLTNIVAADVRPLAVMVANNVPRSGLITMYSKSFNEDESLRCPVLFMSYEDAEDLRVLQQQGKAVVLSMRTATFDGFVGLVLSMAVSPPLMILICYLIIRGMQHWTRRRRNLINQQYVRSLPVHMYNKTHLIPAQHFYDYLVHTNQTNDIPSVSSSTDDHIPAGQGLGGADHEPVTPVSASASASVGLPSVTDLYTLDDMNILLASKDFYPTQKCSICLGHFVALKSRVLVLGCKHIYHEKCLSNWLINFRKTCPLCNKPLHMSECQPFLDHPSSDYGAGGTTGGPLASNYAGDLESQPHDIDSHISNTAVRSLQVASVMSEPVSSNISASNIASSNIASSNTPASFNFPLLNGNSGAEGHIKNTPDQMYHGSFHTAISTFSQTTSLPGTSTSSATNSISTSDPSFVTTKSQQSIQLSQHSTASSYYTSAGILSSSSGDDDETQSYESSRSTLRF
ncbi:hypothetical protein JCM33374_g1453 [Metschnikowia sp. JCM 33374]|nr:hypothetical protein JCM33374_g1453 [Metschnikowia sp. JCM 33374]